MALKVGVFDSGVGGITVLSELRQRFPSIDYVYLGDTAHVPYGPKSPTQIQRLSADCAETLKKKRVDMVVVACNTASSWALAAIEAVMGSVPVLGVVEPGVEAALGALSSKSCPVLVLATKATVQSHAYGKALQNRMSHARGPALKEDTFPIIEQACPLLVPMIEEGWIDHPILHQTLLEYVRPHRDQYSTGVALLGCTHYPWIHTAFQQALPGWEVVNSAWAVAQTIARSELFLAAHSSRTEITKGNVEWIFTDPEAVPDFARRLMKGS